jgi:regulator of sigma E protease
MDIVLAILALGLLIVVHELGHYICAVRTGMQVDRFSVFGIGPAIVKLGHYRGTELVIGAIPFGAYVQIRGMEAEDDGEIDAAAAQSSPESSPNFRDKPLWARFVVLAGGPLANYLAASMILFGVFTSAGVRGPNEAVVIDEVAEPSAAFDGGLRPGDEIVELGEVAIEPAAGTRSVATASEQYLGQTVDIVVRRDGELLTRSVTLPDEPPALGIWFSLRASRVAVGVGEAALRAVEQPIEVTGQQLGALYLLATGQLEADLEGPVGIVKHIARSAESGLIAFLSMAAFISTLLGMFNLLPLPALDGGRMSFLVYEGLMRRPANRRVEDMVHGIGMIALLALIALVTIGDLRGGP